MSHAPGIRCLFLVFHLGVDDLEQRVGQLLILNGQKLAVLFAAFHRKDLGEQISAGSQVHSSPSGHSQGPATSVSPSNPLRLYRS